MMSLNWAAACFQARCQPWMKQYARQGCRGILPCENLNKYTHQDAVMMIMPASKRSINGSYMHPRRMVMYSQELYQASHSKVDRSIMRERVCIKTNTVHGNPYPCTACVRVGMHITADSRSFARQDNDVAGSFHSAAPHHPG